MNVNESKVIVVGPDEGTGKLGTALVLPHAHPPTVTVTVLTGTGADEGRALLKRMEDDGQGARPRANGLAETFRRWRKLG